MQMHNPPHPGQVLKLAIAAIPPTATEYGLHIGVSRVTLSRILNSRAGISAEMFIRLGEAFDQSPDLWFRMQNTYDFWQVSQQKRKKIRSLQTAV